MKKLMMASLLVASTLSSSAFAYQYTNNVYGELGAGGTRVRVGDDHATIESDTVLHVKTGLGYRQNFAQTSPFFWGVDGHYNYYNFDKSLNTIDAAAMLGGYVNPCLFAYAKLGGEYFFDNGGSNQLKPKAGVGIGYKVTPQLTLAAELNSTIVDHDDDVVSSLSGGELSLQYNF